MAKKPAGVMRIALMKRMAPAELGPESDQLDHGDEGFPPEEEPVKKAAGAAEAESGPEEGSYSDALGELSDCVGHLPKDKQAEASDLIDKLKSLFEEKPEEEAPSETEKGPSTGNSIQDMGSY